MKTHHLTVGSIHSNGKPVPTIRLSGNWLAQYGFKIGRPFIVYEQPGSLLLRLILPEDDQ
jgi:Toxin SymE, type I toxin-antitoxin system